VTLEEAYLVVGGTQLRLVCCAPGCEEAAVVIKKGYSLCIAHQHGRIVKICTCHLLYGCDDYPDCPEEIWVAHRNKVANL